MGDARNDEFTLSDGSHLTIPPDTLETRAFVSHLEVMFYAEQMLAGLGAESLSEPEPESTFETMQRRLRDCHRAWRDKSLGVEFMPVPRRDDLSFLQYLLMTAAASPAMSLFGAGWVDESRDTWTCERGCGYDGNPADRVACEVCLRGKGD